MMAERSIREQVAHHVSSSDFSEKPAFKQLVGSLFGFDFFISYAWADARYYAAELAECLERDINGKKFSCFLDTVDFAKGDDWKEAARQALERTSILILVGSPESLTSEPVLREVQFFTERKNRVIPIDFVDEDGNGTLDPKRNPSALHQYIRPEILRIKERQRYREDAPNQLAGPSEDVVTQITGSFDMITQQDKRARVYGAAALVFALVAVLAIVFWRSSESNFREAETQRRVAIVQRLAQQSLSSELDPELNLIFAYEAVQRCEGKLLPSAEHALRRAYLRFGPTPLLSFYHYGGSYPSGQSDHSYEVHTINMSNNGRWLVLGVDLHGTQELWRFDLSSAHPDRSLSIFDSGYLDAAVSAHDNDLAYSSISDDGRTLAAVTGVLSHEHNGVLLWTVDSKDKTTLRRLPWGAKEMDYEYLVISPDSKWLANGLYLWNLRELDTTETPTVLTKRVASSGVRETVFSRDSTALVRYELSNGHYYVHICRLGEVVQEQTIGPIAERELADIILREVPEAFHYRAEFGLDFASGGIQVSPDGKWFLDVSTAQIWRIEQGQRVGQPHKLDLRRPPGNTTFPIHDAVFSPDSQWLATIATHVPHPQRKFGGDKITQIWDLRQGQWDRADRVATIVY